MRYMTLTVLCCLAFGRYAGAMEKPPDAPMRQRSWLSSGLVNDMTEINNRMPGTFADHGISACRGGPYPAEPMPPLTKQFGDSASATTAT